MKRSLTCAIAIGALSLIVADRAGFAQQSEGKARSTIAQSLTPPPIPQSRLESAYIQFPLPKGEEAYASIDGKRMYKYVVELAEISRRYRDTVHPKFWGRITGTSSDHETAAWLVGKFKALGLSDVRIEPINLLPQWFPKTWDVSISSGGQTITLDSAQPAYQARAIPAGTVLDAIYVGLGTEADFIGRDVKGKAVFVYEMLGLKDETAQDAIKLADAKGAAVVFAVSMLPGNMRYQAYPTSTKATAFAMGHDDGNAARAMIEAAKNAPAKVKISLSVETVPNLKSGLVWATLPGATDETIYMMAHMDGWFDGAGDNAGGVASMIEIAQYYSKIPQAQRKRTMVFVGLDGHHNGPEGGTGRRSMVDNRAKLFAKTALMINNEHPSTINTQARPRYYPGDEIAWSNTYMPMQWYAGGKARPVLRQITWDAFKKFGVPVLLEPNPVPPAGDLGRFWRFVPGVAPSEFHNYFHTDWETPETVPWTGLEASTRAFAKIIDEVNKRPLSDFQRPEEPETQRPL